MKAAEHLSPSLSKRGREAGQEAYLIPVELTGAAWRLSLQENHSSHALEWKESPLGQCKLCPREERVLSWSVAGESV